MTSTFADTTNYSWEKTDFSEFQEWAKDKEVPECWGRYHENQAHMVIDWVIETNRNAGRKFFGVAIGKAPHQDPSIINEACKFIGELESFLSHQHRAWLGGKMNDPTFAADRNKGRQDGYWLQTKKSHTEGYLHGYAEGISMKEEEGYTIAGLDTDSPYLSP